MHLVTVSAGFGHYLWQFEPTGRHSGTWSPISVKPDSLLYVNTDWDKLKRTQWDFPRLVSADQEGIARIISQKFNTKQHEEALLMYGE